MKTLSAIELIKECLVTGGNELVDYNNEPREANINISDGDFKKVTHTEYDMNMGSVKVIDSFKYETPNGWDGNWAQWAIFKFDRGYGLAINTGWWGPTFFEDQYDMNICHTDDPDVFDKVMLFDDVREKAANFYMEKEILR